MNGDIFCEQGEGEKSLIGVLGAPLPSGVRTSLRDVCSDGSSSLCPVEK